MTYADRILDVLDDEYRTAPEIATVAGIPRCKGIEKLKVLEKYGLAERGEEVRASNGCMIPTWRRVQ